MALGIFEAMLLAFGIEMRARGFKVGRIAFGVLVKVYGMLAWRKIVHVNLQRDAGSFLRQRDRANGFALSILEFDLGFGFGSARESENNQGGDRGQGGDAYCFHAWDYSEFSARNGKQALTCHA